MARLVVTSFLAYITEWHRLCEQVQWHVGGQVPVVYWLRGTSGGGFAGRVEEERRRRRVRALRSTAANPPDP
eukprot:1140386-Pelagomonas_calceolata.AAC.1